MVGGVTDLVALRPLGMQRFTYQKQMCYPGALLKQLALLLALFGAINSLKKSKINNNNNVVMQRNMKNLAAENRYALPQIKYITG